MNSNEINATDHQHTILVPSEGGATVLLVKPIPLVEIPIRVIAVSPTPSDAITQKILAKVNIWSLN
jgi:CD109 antigen